MSKTATRTRDTQAVAENDRCDECDGEIVTTNGERVCDDCGLIVGENHLDHGPDWRSFDDQETTPRAGTLVDPTRNDNGFSTEIGFERARRSAKHDRLVRAKITSKHNESTKHHEQGRQLRDIKHNCANLNVPKPAADDACVLFKEWHNHSSHKGHDLDAVTAAVVQVAARNHNVGLRTGELTEQFNIDRAALFRNLSRLREEMAVEIPLAKPSMFVDRFVDELDGDVRTQTLARRLANAAEDADLSGARPSSVAAAVVYEAFQAAQWELQRTQPEVAEVADINEYTVRNQWTALKDGGVSAGVAEDLQQDGDAYDAGALHAEEVERVEPSAKEPVVIGSTSKAGAYHTRECYHVERTPARRLKHVPESKIEWHGIDECAKCERIREAADE